MRRTREREGAQKTQKATDSAQREDPVAEGTGDSTEAEECPETESKPKNRIDRREEARIPIEEQLQGSQEECTKGETQRRKTTNQQKETGEPWTRKKESGKGKHRQRTQTTESRKELRMGTDETRRRQAQKTPGRRYTKERKAEAPVRMRQQR